MRLKLAVLFVLLAASFPALAQKEAHDTKKTRVEYRDVDAPLFLPPVITQESVVDYVCMVNPGNPPVGKIRVYCDSGTGLLTCLSSIGANVCPSGGGGGGSAVGPVGTVQGSDGAGNFTALGEVDNGTSLAISRNIIPQGPTPNFDLQAYGGYLSGFTPPTITCTTVALSTTMNCGGGVSDFKVGHGISIPTAGVAPSMSTPTGGVVTPLGILNGTTTYNYKVVPIGLHYELGVASAAFTTTSGASALGVTNATIATNGCSASNGVVTFTTSAAHNFQSGQPVNILRSTTGTSAVEGSWVLASASGSTFTINMGVANGTYCPSGGTAQVVAKNEIQWTIQPYQVIGAIVYRQINSGAYSIAGIQAGMDSAWIDWGFTAPSVPAYFPATPPNTPTNGVFATTITGISGTSVTLASAPTQGVTATTFHDNVANILALCGSSLFNNGTAGGTIYLSPSDPQGSVYVTNSPLNMHTGCPAQTTLSLGAQLFVNYPITPNGGNNFAGTIQAGGGSGAGPSFGKYYTTRILGNAQPMFLLEVGTSGITFQNLNMECLQNYQTCVYHDQDNNGNNVTSITYDNVYMDGGNRSQTFKMAGGFGFIFKGGAIGNSPLAWGVPPALWDVVNFGVGNTQQQLAGIYEFDYTNMGGGEWFFDTESQSGLIGCTGHGTFYEVLNESSYYPSLRFSCGNNPTTAIRIERMTYADAVGGLSTPMVDLTNAPALSNWRIIEPFCATGSQPFFSAPPTVQGITFESGGAGCPTGLASTAEYINTDLEGGGFMGRFYLNTPVQVSGTASFYYPMATPAAPISAPVSSGGSVPTGNHTYSISAVDSNGKETVLGPTISAVTTSGQQTVTVTPPVLPAGAIGYRPYRDGVLATVTPCSGGIILGTTPFVDTNASGCNNNPSSFTQAGIASIGSAGLAANQLTLANQFPGVLIPASLTASRTWTFPDATGTVVLTSGAQTLISKTLTSPVINTGVTGTAIQGTDTLLMSAGTVTGTGASLCTDANGGATTSGCPAGASFYQTVQVAGSSKPQEAKLNFIAGTNMTVSCADNSGATSTDCTLTSSATGATAFSAITAATNSNSGTFAATGNTWDFTGATALKAPVASSFAPTVNGSFGYDSAANKWVFGQNGATDSFGLSSSACSSHNWVSTPATGTATATCTQPAFTDISGTATAAQLPSTAVNSVVNDTNVTGSIAAQVLTLGWTGPLAKTRTLTTTVYTDQANTYTTGLQDFSTAGSLKVPIGAGLVPTTSGLVGYDSTANKFVFGQNGATVSFGLSSSACSTHQWVNTPATGTATASCSQPAFTDISGVATGAQLPNPSATTLGGVESFAAVAHQWINTISTSGVPGSAAIGTNDISPNQYAAGGGTAQAQTVTLSPAATALVAGLQVYWLPSNANTGAAPTLAPNGLTAKSITKFGNSTPLVANDLTTSAIAFAIYDGTEWQLQNPQTSTGGGSSITLQTNGVNNVTQTSLNFITSTTNAIGGTITPSNPSGSQEIFELTGRITPTGGGTGLSSPTAHSLLVTEGSSNFNLLTSPSTNGACVVFFNVTASAAVDPTCGYQGVPVNAQAGSYALLYTDRLSYVKESGASTSTLTLPQVTGTTASNFSFVTQNLNSGTETLTANAVDKIDGSAVGGSATLLPNFAAFVYQDSSSAPGNWWTLKLPTFGAFGSTCANVLSWSTSGGFTCVNASGSMFANFTAHQWLGNNTSSSAAPSPSLIGSSDTSPNWYAAATGTAQAQVVALTPAVTALTTGTEVHFLPVAANTAANPSLAVNGLAAKSITKFGGSTNLVANDLTTSAIAVVIYDGTQWELVNPQTSAGGGGTPCTTTGNSLQYDNAGAFGCVTPFTFSGSTITAASTGILDLSAESGASAFKIPVQAGATSASDGVVDYDSTAKITHIRTNAADSLAAATTSTTTTTTQALFATAVAGVYNPRAIASADLPLALQNGTTCVTQTAGDNTTDCATDAFVTTAISNAIAAVNPAVAVLVATTGSNLTGTYVQVGGGIGDTFTVTATGAFTLDGVALNTVGQRVLIKDQSTASQNGVYTVTVAGTTGVSPVFTRALDYDTPSDVNNTGSIPVQSGTANATTSWLLTSQVTSIGSSGSSLTYAQFSFSPTNIVTAAANFTSGDLVQAAASNKTTSDSGIAVANVVTATSAAAAAKQVCTSGGASKTCAYIDFPQVVTIPSANCVNSVAGSGWSLGASGVVTCRAGTNNTGGYVAITDTTGTFGQFSIPIPEDWDTGTLPYIRFQLAYPGTDGASAHTIIPQIKVSCAKGDGTTSDDVTFNAAHSSSTITLSSATANLFFVGSNVQMNSTDMTGCVAGSMMVVQVGRATDTATSAANFYSATITFPRLIAVQAN